MATLSFGLGDNIPVNTIIGLPTLKQWKIVLNVDEGYATSKAFSLYFDLSFKHAATGLPPSVTFTSDQFVRPAHPNSVGMPLLTILACKPSQPVLLTNNQNIIHFQVPIADDSE